MELTKSTAQLPSTIPELTRFALVGRDKLKAVRAEIHAIEKVGLAQEVREQKLQEAQEIAEVVTDAEVRIGELLKQIPKATNGGANQYQAKSQCSEIKQKPKSQVIKENGLTQRQAEHFQIMADNPDSVARAKEKARKNGEVLSRSAVLNQIIDDCPKPKTAKQEAREAREKHDEFQQKKSEGGTLSFREIKEDAYNVRIIGRDFYGEILSAVQKVNGLSLFRDQTDIDATIKTIPQEQRKRLGDSINNSMAVLQFLKKKITEVK